MRQSPLLSKARAFAGLLVLAAAAALGGCGSLPQVDNLRDSLKSGRLDLPPVVELTEVPFFAQEDYQCGPAALAMVLQASGVKATPEALVEQVYLPAREGSLQVEMLAAARRNGRVAYELAASLPDVLREVAAGNPVIVLQNTSIRPLPLWHYAVVVGYDLEKKEILLRSGTRERKHMPFTAFDFFWRDGKYWSMVAMPAERLPVTAHEVRYGAAVAAVERLGRITEAQQAYDAMLARWPESFIALMGLGNTRYAQGRLTQAESAFRRATLAKPTDTAAFNNLAQTLADMGQWQEALIPARRAVELGGPLVGAARATLQAIEQKIAALPVAPAPAAVPATQVPAKKSPAKKKKARKP
ncbi:MAG: PA2778 family cysteine peptidase [Gammaproteobacteria bacterium]|nr:PA2778 family cysteine peptidase [Gammaproteobacteria bacterium]MBU1647691.1 PA2778 family cysteine peptidase [Gammaproteobacteria bacterium]MBU1971837.1 PA2778 family cysteine peptidase [Gammaproteobacteria bacterium]